MPKHTLAVEQLPAFEQTAQNLVLLCGWASNREIWRPMLAQLRGWANLTLIDLPGCSAIEADNGVMDLDGLIAAIIDRVPPRAVYVGWSLGGQIATQLAARYPRRVTALVTLCSNPCFVAQDDWPGMPPDVFDNFHSGVMKDPVAALRRFDHLQASGAQRPRVLRRQLAAMRTVIPQAAPLLAGLELLGQQDLRALLPQLQQPQLHLLAGRDSLVPGDLLAKLKNLLDDTTGARVVVLPELGHAMIMEAPAELAAAIRQFMLDADLLQASSMPLPAVAKRAVADSFSRAAEQYDSVASLQRDVGASLLSILDVEALTPNRVLDLGCGTGHFYPALRQRFPGAEYVGLDLAPGMVNFARARFPEADQWLVGDAEQLSLADNSVDLIFSSLALQWCSRLDLLFSELARILRPGGRCVFTSLGPDTLRELRSSWAAVDGDEHVNTFLPSSALTAAVAALPDVSLVLDQQQFCMQYSRVKDLLTELKTLGAHNMNSGRPHGLTGRRAIQGMLQAYEAWRENDQLPATYDVLFGVLEKTCVKPGL